MKLLRRDLFPAVDVKVIGPFLGFGANNSLRIFVALPDATNVDELRCVVTREDDRGGDEAPHELAVTVTNKPWRLFTFEFADLVSGASYSYQFIALSGALDLEGGLGQADCRFRAPAPFTESDSFILLSCHNPFQKQPYADVGGWDLWTKLLALLRRDASVSFLVLGGDQVYNDDVEAEYLDELDDDGRKNVVRKRFFRQYQKYWGHPDYRRVLARIPSLAMWDDHDITDGWGGRPESVDGEGFRAEWQTYFSLATEAFRSYQACRNPPPLLPGTPPFTTYHDFGPNRLYLMDFRSERAAHLGRLWKPEHEAAFMESLRRALETVRTVFILSPVVPIRTALGDDRRLHAVSSLLFKANRWLRRKKLRLVVATAIWGSFALGALLGPRFIDGWNHYALWLATMIALAASSFPIGAAWLVPLIPELPDLADDLDDGLSSECNRPSLVRLLRAAFDWQVERHGQVVLLSGDIHAGGMSELLDTHDGRNESIPQVVSSPIAYTPMPKVIAGLTTSTSEIVLGEDGACRLLARNIFYTSRRNFVQIFPGRIGTGSRHPFVFHLERHADPLAMPARFRADA